MIKYIFYKELVKTKTTIILLTFILISMLVYMNVEICKAIEFSSRETLCLQILVKDGVLFPEFIYIPVTIGCILSIAQYIPEIHHKRLKLTLHLPVSAGKIVLYMILFALMVMSILFFMAFIWIYLVSSSYMPQELVTKVINTHLVWIIAGVTTYGLVSWTIIEPNIKRKIANGIITILTISLFFISPYPQSYDSAFLLLMAISILSLLFVWISINRFKSGF